MINYLFDLYYYDDYKWFVHTNWRALMTIGWFMYPDIERRTSTVLIGRKLYNR